MSPVPELGALADSVSKFEFDVFAIDKFSDGTQRVPVAPNSPVLTTRFGQGTRCFSPPIRCSATRA
jgi:hypothetical protein